MLKIIMGTETVQDFVGHRNYEIGISGFFNEHFEDSWTKDKLALDIIKTIDKAEVIAGGALKSIETGEYYSVTNLSGGAKFLLNIYHYPDKLFLMTMGDNCTDFLEQIAEYHNERGQDILVVSDYLHHFKFKYTKNIEYVNWNVVCHSWKDILDNIEERWYEQERIFRLNQKIKLGLVDADGNDIDEWDNEEDED